MRALQRGTEMAKRAGFQSLAAFPVTYNGKTYGVFALYGKKVNFLMKNY